MQIKIRKMSSSTAYGANPPVPRAPRSPLRTPITLVPPRRNPVSFPVTYQCNDQGYSQYDSDDDAGYRTLRQTVIVTGQGIVAWLI
jgi:hypothetical protein